MSQVLLNASQENLEQVRSCQLPPCAHLKASPMKNCSMYLWYTLKVFQLFQAVDYRPILDLSDVPETVTTVFQSSSNGQVTVHYSEVMDAGGDSVLSLKVDLPDTADVDIDFEYRTLDQSMCPRFPFCESAPTLMLNTVTCKCQMHLSKCKVGQKCIE